MRRQRNGMTIIEVIIVMVIIGILASIAILTLVNTRKHAIATEAIVGLSSLKQAMKYYYVEYDKYQDLNGFLPAACPQGINPGFVDGTYFQDPCYMIEVGADRLTGKIKCFPANSTNPYGAGIADDDGAYIALDLDGTFSQHNISGTAYKNE